MGLNFYLTPVIKCPHCKKILDLKEDSLEYKSFNITHNLGKMADKADIYKALWRPEEIGVIYAKDIINLLENGIKKLQNKPKYFKKFESENGYGTYDGFLSFVVDVLIECKNNPDFKIEVSR